MIGHLLAFLSGTAYGPMKVDTDQQDKRIEALEHRLDSEIAGMKRTSRLAARSIAARSALVEEILRPTNARK